MNSKFVIIYLYSSTFADVLSARLTSSQRISDRYNSVEYFHKNHSRSLSREQVGFFFFPQVHHLLSLEVQKRKGPKRRTVPSKKFHRIRLTLVCEI